MKHEECRKNAGGEKPARAVSTFFILTSSFCLRH
jgi:hypothetical protein